jgi:hypothetical protein
MLLFTESIVKNIVTMLAQLLAHINYNKKEGHLIIGYVRKTPASDPIEVRVRL